MIILEENVSVVNLLFSNGGKLENLAEFIGQNGLIDVTQNLLGVEFDVYNTTDPLSIGLKKENRIISTRSESSANLTVGGAFDSGFDLGFDTE